MGKYSGWKLDGWIAEDFDKHLDGPDGIDRVLQDTGAYGVNAMRAVTGQHKASGRLNASIMYITDKGISSAVRSPAESSDTLEKPTTERTLLVGSGAPHAIYRETYSGVHQHFEGHEEFEESMKKWVETVMGINPDGPPEDKEAFYLIMEHIRNSVTEGTPFVLPNTERITKYALLQLKR